jgi:NADPH-dependent 2,4-dienoyl-CoA reductase/sulfur reductase-like enzyme
MERLAQERQVTCLYNPEVGREGELSPAPERKRVWVIGGGPAGMQAAITAAARGHDVKLFEKEARLGGQALPTAMTPGKERFAEVTDFLANELDWKGVAVQAGREITSDEVLRAKPDAVIVATGSVPLVPDIPGIASGHVVTAWEALKEGDPGANIVVASRGFVGAEVALFLAAKGKSVVLLEAREDIAADIGPMNRMRIREELKRNHVDARCGAELLGVAQKSVRFRGKDGEGELPADTVVLALGTAPCHGLLRDLEGKVGRLLGVGDCVEPRNMTDAIQDGYAAALKI